MTLYDKVITAQGVCSRKDCKNCPCWEHRRCTYLEEVNKLVNEQYLEIKRLTAKVRWYEEGENEKESNGN